MFSKRSVWKLGLRAYLVVALTLVLVGCGSNSSGGGGDGDGGQNNSTDANVNDNGNDNDNGNANGNANSNNNNTPACPDGTDNDGDGYGEGCPAGGDCDDSNPLVNEGAEEVCNYLDDDCDGETDEGVLTPCGNCSQHCTEGKLGDDPFPMPEDDENASANGVNLDPNGDIILDGTNMDFNFLWIANRYDAASRGTVSKIDSENVEEVARYYTVTCFGNPAYQNGECLDVAGTPIQIETNHPSRTAVDYNFDMWVANRAFNGQASATKIANALEDCIDRNGNGVIDTSQDRDGDGNINIDCDGDGNPDDITTTCDNGLPPEFMGHDDECILHTTNYAGINEVGRSICLDAGDPYTGGAGNAWVGTYHTGADGNNEFYKLDGDTGEIVEVVELPGDIHVYGCAVDGHGILWVSELGGAGQGRTVYFDTINPSNMGSILQNPWGGHYGLSIDADQNIWFAGWSTQNVMRYRPDRTTFSSLSQGIWTQIRTVEEGSIDYTRGVAADLRGWVWVAANAGYIFRLPQDIADGNYSWAEAVAQGAMRINTNLGGTMIGVGVDFEGHVWGMSYNNSTATRVDLDANGDPVDLTNNVFTVDVGLNPYTYSDFTGYGLRNFTRPRGTYRYVMEGCSPDRDTTWLSVEWNSTEPQNTEVVLRVRSGDDPTDMGDWFGTWDTSPAMLEEPPQGPIWPSPARYLEVEFELSSPDQEATPILHDFNVVWDCSDDGPK